MNVNANEKPADALDECDAERESQRKERACMMCGEGFESEWFGERICRKCKSTAAYRQG